VERPLDALLQTFIGMIEAGAPPWRQPWANGGRGSLPRRADGHPFSGTNCWILAAMGAATGRSSPYWFTFRQALAIEACVRKGERGQHVILFKTRSVEAAGEDGEAETRTLKFLRSYVVFNGDQLDGLPEPFRGAPAIDEGFRVTLRDETLDAVPAEIVLGGERACYVRATDRIHLPPPETFVNADEFQSTKAHELAHWSGAETRLGRDFGRRFGDQAYAFEELVAELAASLLGLHLATPPQTLASHAAYLADWVSVLKDRPGALVEASGHAQRAADFLLGFSRSGALPDAGATPSGLAAQAFAPASPSSSEVRHVA
jgi:antirestriction protein ArdC